MARPGHLSGLLTHDFKIEYFNGGLARSLKFLMRTPEQVAEDLSADSEIRVALPKGADWYDFWTGRRHASAETVTEKLSLARFPLYVKAGSIQPLGPTIEWATQRSNEPAFPVGRTGDLGSPLRASVPSPLGEWRKTHGVW